MYKVYPSRYGGLNGLPITDRMAYNGDKDATNFTDEPLIDIRGLAQWLCVSEHAVRRWTATGPRSGLAPRMLRVNGQIRFRPQDVRDWLETKEIR